MREYVYLLACEHSGSTLLAFVLASHPQIASVGELAGDISADYKCSCGSPMKECQFWRQVITRMSKLGYQVDIDHFDINILIPNTQNILIDFFLHYFPYIKLEKIKISILRRIFPSIWKDIYSKIQRNIAFAEVICDIENADIFFDTTKDIYRLRFLKEFGNYPVKVIHLVRDGKGVVNSFIKREKSSPDKAVKVWVWMNKMIERIKRLYFNDDDWLFIRYEDFCSRPDDVLKKIAHFLKVPNTFNLSPFVKERYHIIGNTMRLTFDGNIRLPSNRSYALPYEVERLFNSIAHDFYKKYLYI